MSGRDLDRLMQLDLRIRRIERQLAGPSATEPLPPDGDIQAATLPLTPDEHRDLRDQLEELRGERDQLRENLLRPPHG
jgi:hypothetical protein